MRAGVPSNVKLAGYMGDKGAVWDSVVRQHALRPTRLESIALWAYGDYQFRPEWDMQSTMTKARDRGFGEAPDSGTMFARHFAHYRAAKIIP